MDRKPLRQLHSDQRGASMLEYALIAACISVVCIAGVSVVGRSGAATFHDIAEHINDAGTWNPDAAGNGNDPTIPP